MCKVFKKKKDEREKASCLTACFVLFPFKVFIRRIVQVCAELQDGRDIVLAICKSNLSVRQWRLLCDITGSSDNLADGGEDEEDSEFSGNFGLGLTGFDLDPSVRFFGIDWDRVFGRCFSLSMNIKVFGEQLQGSEESSVDLILVNTILRDLSTIEADVTSHAEAVLQGRLSKSQQRLIRKEQLKNCQPVPDYVKKSSSKSVKSSNSMKNQRSKSTKLHKSSVSKSKSFRAPSSNSQQRQQLKYKKNKTTDLERLTTAAAAVAPEPDAEEKDVDTVSKSISRSLSITKPVQAPVVVMKKEEDDPVCRECENVPDSDEDPAVKPRKKSTKLFRNFSSLFKHIRW